MKDTTRETVTIDENHRIRSVRLRVLEPGTQNSGS